MSLNIENFAGDLGDLFVQAGQDFYADAQEQWEEDKAFFEEIKGKYKEASQVYLQAKLAGDDSLADQMVTAMRQYTLSIRATVETSRLKLEAQVKVELGAILENIGKAIGAILGGAILAAL